MDIPNIRFEKNTPSVRFMPAVTMEGELRAQGYTVAHHVRSMYSRWNITRNGRDEGYVIRTRRPFGDLTLVIPAFDFDSNLERIGRKYVQRLGHVLPEAL